MSFIVSRASTLGLLLSAPLFQALACSSPDRQFADADETGGAKAQGGRSGGTGPIGGKSQGGQAGKSTGTGGDASAGVGPGGDTGTAGSNEGGEANAGGGAGGAPDAGAGGTLSGGKGGGTSKGGSAGSQGTGGITASGGSAGALGSGGTNTGGTAGKGGSNTGGTTGGTNTGGTSTGGTTGGTAGKGGSGGSGGTCTATGAEICTDGKDNDCNGHTDCLTFSAVFPDPNGAAAGKDVLLTANAPAITGYTFQCRSARGGAVADNVPWVACQTGANTRIIPRTAAESQLATSNGLWTTQVRALFPSGATTDHFSHTYYMHSSLHTATRCTSSFTDQAFITTGRGYLNDAGVFGSATILRSPFIQLGFTPPISTRFEVVAGNGVVKVASLRRRFTRSADDKYLLLTRNYSSSRSNVCDGLDLRTHDSRITATTYNNNNQYLDDCNVVLFNRAGSGICLYVDTAGAIQAVKHNNTYTLSPTYSPTADNFAWRKLHDRKVDGLVHFSPKCFAAGCTATMPNAYYLPDRTLFPYF